MRESESGRESEREKQREIEWTIVTRERGRKRKDERMRVDPR